MRPALLLCSFLLCLGCARSVEPTSRAGDAASPASSGPSPEAGECRTDEDCALTMIPEGECCPMSCEGRVVTAAEARRLEALQRECEERQGMCPLPPCAPPRMRTVAVCTGGRCNTRQMPMDVP